MFLLVIALFAAITSDPVWAGRPDIEITTPRAEVLDLSKAGSFVLEGTSRLNDKHRVRVVLDGDEYATVPLVDGEWGLEVEVVRPLDITVQLLNPQGEVEQDTDTLRITIGGIGPSPTAAETTPATATPTTTPSPTPSPKATTRPATPPTPQRVRLVVMRADFDPATDRADIVLEAKGANTVILSSPFMGPRREAVRKDGRVRFAKLDLNPNGVRPTPDTYQFTATAYDPKRRPVGDQLTIAIEVPEPPTPPQPSRWERFGRWAQELPRAAWLAAASVILALVLLAFALQGRRERATAVAPAVKAAVTFSQELFSVQGRKVTLHGTATGAGRVHVTLRTDRGRQVAAGFRMTLHGVWEFEATNLHPGLYQARVEIPGGWFGLTTLASHEASVVVESPPPVLPAETIEETEKSAPQTTPSADVESAGAPAPAPPAAAKPARRGFWLLPKALRRWIGEVDSGQWPPQAAAVRKMEARIFPCFRTTDGSLPVHGSGPVESTLTVLLDGGEGTTPTGRRDGVVVKSGAAWEAQFTSSEVPLDRFRIYVSGSDPAGQLVGPIELWVEAVAAPAVVLPPILESSAPSEGMAAEESPAPPAPADPLVFRPLTEVFGGSPAPAVPVDSTPDEPARPELVVSSAKQVALGKVELRGVTRPPRPDLELCITFLRAGEGGKDVGLDVTQLGAGRWVAVRTGVRPGRHRFVAGLYPRGEGKMAPLASAPGFVEVRDDFVEPIDAAPPARVGDNVAFTATFDELGDVFVEGTAPKGAEKVHLVVAQSDRLDVNVAQPDGYGRPDPEGRFRAWIHGVLPGDWLVRATALAKDLSPLGYGESRIKPYAPPPASEPVADDSVPPPGAGEINQKGGKRRRRRP